MLQRHRFVLSAAPLWLACTAAPCVAAAAHAQGPSILFVRGADGSGGLGQGTQQERTEHLSDIGNTSTAPGNHGFGELAALLRQDGFAVSQWIESAGGLDRNVLDPHAVVVFGSNNRGYAAREAAALTAWVDAGGAALFASDANWGPDWNAAPRSDNDLLAAFGAAVYQDSASGVLVAAAATHYAWPDHAALAGPDGSGGGNDVAAFVGEGVSFFHIDRNAQPPPAVVVTAAGWQVRDLTANGETR